MNIIDISNDGLRESAIIIFNKKGELIVHVPHNFAAIPLTYCSQSITKVRLWYDEVDPGIEFSKNDSVITLLGCDGRRLNITEMLK